MDRAWVELIEAAARRPRGVATVFPTSRALARQLVGEVTRAPAGPVVELGAGGGAITRLLVPTGRQLTALEVDPELARFLAESFPSVTVRCAPAEEIGQIASPGSLGAVVSSLPWTLLPTLGRERILAGVRAALAPGGVFATYLCLNALLHPGGRSFLARVRAHFGKVETRPVEWRNIPPARMVVARAS